MNVKNDKKKFIGGFLIIDLIGKGAFGKVTLGVHKLTGK